MKRRHITDVLNDPLPVHYDSDGEIITRYDPDDHSEPVECPYCGKKIPMDINFCYFCGKSLGVFKRIEPVRQETISKLDEVLAGLGKTAARTDIAKIRDLTDKIIRKYYEDPYDNNDYDKFINFYLPKTVAAAEHYQVLCSLDNLDGEQTGIKKQLEEALDTLADAFGNILNRISTEKLFDISTDVSVLESVLKQEGLTDPDFTVSPGE